MATTSMVFGGLLVLLGVSGYVLTDRVSVTALIPAVFGVVLLGLGALGNVPARRKLAMHIAMVVAVLGIAGSITGLVAIVSGGEMTAAVTARALMAGLLLVYLGLGVRSFVAARANR